MKAVKKRVLRLYAFTDLHGNAKALSNAINEAEKSKCDFLICAGDLCNFATGLSKMLEALSMTKLRVLIVPGNHETPESITKAEREYGFTNLDLRAIKFDKFTIGGLGGSNPTPFNTPNEASEHDIKKRLAKLKGLPNLILISHVPPLGILDLTSMGVNAGSKSLLEFIKEEQPLIVICGHIHENEGFQEVVGRTKVINPGMGSVIEVLV